MVTELRADGDIIKGLSLVAEELGTVVGHVVCSRAMIGDTLVLGLGPLGVLPAGQRAGVGSALMYAVIVAADVLGFPAIVLLGSPAYYARFGFALAEPLGIIAPHGEWAPFFQVRQLSNFTPDLQGLFAYAPSFRRL